MDLLRPFALVALAAVAGCSGAYVVPVPYDGPPDAASDTPKVGVHLPPPEADAGAPFEAESPDAQASAVDTSTGDAGDAATTPDAVDSVDSAEDAQDAKAPPVDAWTPPPGTCGTGATWCPTGTFPTSAGTCPYPESQGDAADRCGGCTYLDHDSNNCGACGIVCAVGTACYPGKGCTAI